ncbi:hypothetical protein Dimus_002968 [Dionaea muscipula]
MSLRTWFYASSMRGLFQHLRYRGGSSGSTSSSSSSVVRWPMNIGDYTHSSAALGLRLFKTRSVAAAGIGKQDEPPLSTALLSPPPAPPRPVRPPTPGSLKWARWILVSIFSRVLKYWIPKWGTLLKIGGKTELVMQEVEKVVMVAEKVATVAEKVSADIAEQLPDDTKFKAAALVAEHVSEEAANDARILEQIIHKVDEVKQDVEDIEKLAEPVIDKIIHEKQDPNKL